MKRDSFRLGVVHYVSYPDAITGEGPIALTLEKVLNFRELQAVEITWVKGSKQRAFVRTLLESWEGVVVYSGAPVLALSNMSLSSHKDDLRKDSVALAKRIIDDACYFGASEALLISGPDPGKEKRDGAKAYLIESLLEIVDYAGTVNERLMVTIEPADRDIHRRQFIGPISEAVEIVSAVRVHAPNFGLTIDMSHLAQLGENKSKALHTAKGYFRHVHIANAIIKNQGHSRFGDEHPRFGIEEGEHDQESITDFLRELTQIGFFQQDTSQDQPIISIEVKPDKSEDPQALLVESIKTFLTACSMA